MFHDSRSLNNFFQNFEDYSSPLALGPRPVDLSFVIPVMNEEESLVELTRQIVLHVPAGLEFEIIFIDDGSSDDSWQVIRALSDVYGSQIRGFRFRSNLGEGAALQLGFDAAQGDYVFTMDGDLQDDPREIPRFLPKNGKGFDLVSGWKMVRHDPWNNVQLSRVCNRMLSYFS